MVRKESVGGSRKVGEENASSGDDQKIYRITIICGKTGGPVTADNAGAKFTCPACGSSAVVDVGEMKLVCDGHYLKKVVEIGV